MSGNGKFFFEEDVSELGSGVGVEEQADLFEETLLDAGLSSEIESMAPMGVQRIVNDVKRIENNLLTVEYGFIDKDYVLHVSPIHPHRNLRTEEKLHTAIREIIIELNKSVPFDLRVDIHLPQEDWEIKATSFIVRGASEAWNFNREEMDDTIIPAIEKKVSEICVKL